MQYKVLPVLLLVFIFLTPSHGFAWQGEVVQVKDGDRLVLLRESKKVDVRLYGVDAPEKKQPFGTCAAKFVTRLAGREKVEIIPIYDDQQGRVYALVYIEGDGECLNEEIVRAGYAWVDDRSCRIRDCDHWQTLQRQARLAGQGLWSDPEPVPPWEWEHGGDECIGSCGNSCSGKERCCREIDAQDEGLWLMDQPES